MIENVIRIIVDGSGNVIDQPSSNDTIRALNNGVDKIVMIAPFPAENWASVSYLRYNATPLEQYLYSRAAPVSNYVESDETFSGYTYHDIADWTVYECDIKATALAYISKHRNGSILISLANGELSINSKCITYEGVFGVDNPLPTTAQTEGDYYMCEDYAFTMADNGNGRAYIFGKGQYVYWNGSYWVKVLLQKKMGTPSIEIPVDPSFAEGYELDDDDINYLATIAADVVLIDGRVTVLEGFKTDIDNGDYVFPYITLPNDTIIRFNSDKEVVEHVLPDGTILQVGLEMWAYVRNENGSPLLNGEVAAINGVVGQQLSAIHADPSDDNLHFREIGVVTDPNNIAVNGEGKVTHFGEVNGIPIANLENTGIAYAENQELFVSVNGKLTNVRPAQPIAHIHAGWVLRTVGSTVNVFVYFVQVPHLNHLSDVDDTGLLTDDVLKYNASTGIWSRDGRVTDHATRITALETFATSGVIPKGSITYENLLLLTGVKIGDMYNITNDFSIGDDDYLAGTNAVAISVDPNVWDFTSKPLPTADEIELSDERNLETVTVNTEAITFNGRKIINKSTFGGFIAHRGFGGIAPENTLKSISEAGRFGFARVEIDLQLTSDGEWILMHDSTVDRTTDGTGTVSSLLYSYIQTLKIDTPTYQINEDEIIKIPTFEEALKEISINEMGVNIDGDKMSWTQQNVLDMYEYLTKYNLHYNSWFYTTNQTRRQLINSNIPEMAIAWLSSSATLNNDILEAKNYRYPILIFHANDITQEIALECNENGIDFMVYRADTIDAAYEALEIGAKYIETDYIVPKGRL